MEEVSEFRVNSVYLLTLYVHETNHGLIIEIWILSTTSDKMLETNYT